MTSVTPSRALAKARNPACYRRSVPPAEPSLERGLALIRAREYFAGHEELEDVWRAASDEERDFFQGLVHVAVAWYQAGRGNRVGCERQLEKAQRRLDPYRPSHRGVDLERLLGSVREAAETVDAGSLELPDPAI